MLDINCKVSFYSTECSQGAGAEEASAGWAGQHSWESEGWFQQSSTSWQR